MRHLVATLLGMVAGCAVLAGCSQPAGEPAPEPVAEVSTAPAVIGDLPVVLTGFGRVEFDPAGQHTLSAEIEARVLEVLARPGDAVSKGSVVLRLGPSSGTGLDLARSRRDALAAQAAAERTRRLRDDGFASDADVEAADTNAQDLAALADSLAGRAGSVSALRSPIDGVVDAVLVAAGDLIPPGAQLVRLASPQAIQARISVEIEDAARLRTGGAVQLERLDPSAETLASSIRLIDHRVDPSTRMASVLVPIPAGHGFLTGEAVSAELVAEVRQGCVLVPRRAVLADEGGSYLFLAADGRAALRRVRAGLTTGEQTEILSGLDGGETVIVEGAAILSDGMRIRLAASAPEPRP